MLELGKQTQKGQLFLEHVTSTRVTKGGQEVEAVASPSDTRYGNRENFADDDVNEGTVSTEVGEDDELVIELMTPDRDWVLRAVGRDAVEWVEQLEHHVPYVGRHHPPPATRQSPSTTHHAPTSIQLPAHSLHPSIAHLQPTLGMRAAGGARRRPNLDRGMRGGMLTSTPTRSRGPSSVGD